MTEKDHLDELLNNARENKRSELDGVRARHKAAQPKPHVNPAWANAEHDIKVLLNIVDDLAEALSMIADGEAANPAAFAYGALSNHGLGFPKP